MVHRFSKSQTQLKRLGMTTSRGNKGSDSRVCLQCRRPRFNTGLERSTGECNGNPFQYSGLGSPMDRGTWWATAHGAHKELDTTEQLTNTSGVINGNEVTRKTRVGLSRKIKVGLTSFVWISWPQIPFSGDETIFFPPCAERVFSM